MWKFPAVASCNTVIQPIKHDKASRHRKSKGFKLNLAMHPFVLIAIAAALALIVMGITLFYFRFLKG